MATPTTKMVRMKMPIDLSVPDAVERERALDP